jgi:E3 ubiquitin-protein ligase NEDD4
LAYQDLIGDAGQFLQSIFNIMFEKTWQIVGRMTAEEKKVLLFFWTSVKYLPVEGFCGLSSRLHIYKSHEPCNRLPSSHTCFHRLCFPVYPSMPVMEARLKVITQEHIGSSFGTW